MIKYLTGLLLLLNLACAAAGQLEPYRGFAQTPALSLEDLGHKLHTLQDYRGRVVLVNFWASWCGPCVVEMPSMQRLQNAMTGKPFTLLAVNVEESPGTVWKFAAKVKIRFPPAAGPRRPDRLRLGDRSLSDQFPHRSAGPRSVRRLRSTQMG